MQTKSRPWPRRPQDYCSDTRSKWRYIFLSPPMIKSPYAEQAAVPPAKAFLSVLTPKADLND
jgi:hypothetical protein